MLFFDEKLDPDIYNPLALAYIGDTVYDLFVRTMALSKGNRHVTVLHKEAVRFVKAQSQAKSAHGLEEFLTEEELRVLKWGRNAKSNTSPKNADIRDYRMATGFETLIGYLYLRGDTGRLCELLEIAYNIIDKQHKE